MKSLGSYNFYIIGDGTEKEKLEKLIKENKVEKTFYLSEKNRKRP